VSEVLEVRGEKRLEGVVRVSGAKNAALPMLMATLLTAERCDLSNVPNLEDTNLALSLLEHFGAQTAYDGDLVSVTVPALVATEASYSLVKALRASFWVLGPLLARGGAARVALPGGDIIGARPVDLHLAALEKMGAEIAVKHGVVFATAKNGLTGTSIKLRFPSVGATHQILMAASLARGETVIEGAACEPEVEALAEMLSRMGAAIEGAGSSTIRIRGQSQLGGVKIKLIGDRIEAGTYLLGAAVTRGKVRVDGVVPSHLSQLLPLLTRAGCTVTAGPDWVQLCMNERMRAVDCITAPFPGFATDLQAPWMAGMTVAQGTSRLEETIFEGRFGHVAELCRMGADIRISDRVAEISGREQLSGALVEARDIRAGAALVVAALSAQGVSYIHEIQHLRRGYAALEQKLQGLGAQVRTIDTDADDLLFSGC
jgi:UDP-N-acetylglucosamine 1-carboxyvinyltransferase